MLQISPAQTRRLLQLRRDYITNVALVSRQRQQLLQQMQSIPLAMGISSHEFGSSLSTVDDILQQLQQCVCQEDELFYGWQGTVALTVSCCTL